MSDVRDAAAFLAMAHQRGERAKARVRTAVGLADEALDLYRRAMEDSVSFDHIARKASEGIAMLEEAGTHLQIAGTAIENYMGSALGLDQLTSGSGPGDTTPGNRTAPSGARGGPFGAPELASRSSSVKQRSLASQNEVAEMLARQDFHVVRLPERPGHKSPDYLIEGRIFDAYAPEPGTSVEGIRSRLRSKLRTGSGEQARRFIIDLRASSVSAADLRQRIQRRPPTRLQEIIAIDKNGITPVWPHE